MKKPDHADVVVVGAGASGVINSLVLAEAGLKVVCLDQGGWTQPSQHPHFSRDFQHQRHNKWSPEPALRRGADDYPVEGDQSHAFMWNGVGGSTNIYAALWPRFRPSDFRKGTEHGLAPDWPITYEDLAPFYDAADRMIGVSGLAGDPAVPPVPDYPCGPLPLRESGRAIGRGFDRLGWHWWPMPAGVLSESRDGRAACNGCGNCASGCPRGSMAKMSVTLWPRALAAGVELRAQARVERIETGPDGRATGVVYIDRTTGDRVLQTADIVIIAGNGVGTPRLLLLSENVQHPNGLSNTNDVVGRYLLHHTLVAAEIWVDEKIDSHMGNSGAVVSREFAETDVSRGFVNGFNFNVVRTGPAGQTAIGSFAQRPAPWGEDHHRWFARHFSHSFGAYAIGDDLPRATNRITLSATERDQDGLAAAKLHYTPCANDIRMMHYGMERLRDLARAVNAFDVAVTDYYENGVYRTPAWHLLGTCRMGDDPATSVTNKYHQCWEVPNVYVCDASSFVTGGVVNPTSTVTALALRCATNLAKNFQNLRHATRTVREYA
ncbi:GMC family oxidoreductase [Acidocella sp.]|jgi:choline dehydrogenase-like flavoprotein|uniref:GMC family oxidoreductase n=1 Tax=Acidocella sp. TaxID=50710 RepID=UPI002F41FFAB